jgi:hypothetical protein
VTWPVVTLLLVAAIWIGSGHGMTDDAVSRSRYVRRNQ